MLDPRLIVSIVRRGGGTLGAGAQGGTVVFGRGIGRNEQQKVFGIQIEPEKEIVLTVVPSSTVERVLEAVVRSAELSVTGHGLAFVVALEQVAGIAHLDPERDS